METPGGVDLVVIGTDIVAGSVLIKSSLRLPESAHFAFRQYGSWKILAGIDGFAAKRKCQKRVGISSLWCRRSCVLPCL